MASKKWMVLGIIGIAVILFVTGCGLLDQLFSDNTNPANPDIWIDQGVWSDTALAPLAEGGKGTSAVQFVPDQLIVKLKPGKFTDSAINTLCSKHSVKLRGRINKLRLILVSLPAGADLEATKAKLEAEADVESVGLNYVYQLFGAQSQTVEPNHITNDPWMPLEQWGLFAIGFHKIPASVLPTSAPIIAVVDTGVDYTHPDLGTAKIIKGPDYWDGDMDPMDTFGHGTHVAGIAAALTDNQVGVAGVSGKSKVLAVRVAGTWWIPLFAGVAGIVYAADYSGVKVINLSWGGSYDSDYLRDAINYATGKGILVVAAAGNEDTPAPTYPAAYENVLAVGATEAEEVGCEESRVRKAYFSNYGDYVDIAAPGVWILSTIPGGEYELYCGTSMASPYVAGAAALIWGKWPSLTRQQVYELLVTTGDPSIDPDEDGVYFPAGVKHLNLYNAFAAKMTMPPAGGALLGLVVDANTGLPLQGATVTAKSGSITCTATTRSNGTFTITNMPAGDYMVSASKSGYVTTTDETTWYVPEGCRTGVPFFALPKTQSSDVWTAVLEWRGWCGMYELDSYLWLPETLPPRNRYMVCFLDRGNLNAPPYARFVRDEPGEMLDRFWRPLYVETLTFRTKYTGTYMYAVNDFNGYGNWECADAVVRLYRGGSLVGTYLARTASGSGDWWIVFKISGTTVIPVQTIGSDFPGPYGYELFLDASQQKPKIAEPGIPSGQYKYMPR
jgi:thermitase